MRLTGARVLVTGASSGIGTAIAHRAAARGATVLATGRSEEALRALGFPYLVADLADPDAPSALAAWAGEVDVFAGNAGIGYAGAFEAMPAARVGELVTVNLTATLTLARLLVGPMVARRRGALLLVSSIAGVLGVPSEAVYAASKAGLLAFADSVRLELAPHGVQVNTVIPGVVDTPFFARRGADYDRARPRPVSADSVAAAAVAAVERDRAEVVVPGWLRLPARLQGAAPGLLRTVRRRTG